MLTEKLKDAPLNENLKKDFAPFPGYQERNKWAGLPEEIKSYYSEKGKQLKDKKWESLPASFYMDLQRTGDRSNYERLFFSRRGDLFSLLMAELIEGQQEYIDDIINGVWLICEETTWVTPAHNWKGHKPGDRASAEDTRQVGVIPASRWTGHKLVDIEEPIFIDLTSAETASLLSWVHFFLGDILYEAEPVICKRIISEIEKKIINPFIEADSFKWMGLTHDKPVDNWNPWINSNILASLLLLPLGRELKLIGVEKAMKCIDRYIDPFPDDGGCDEGPGYFGVAGGCLFDFLEILHIAAGGKYDVYGNEKIKNIASYIYKVYIAKNYSINYADAHRKQSPNAYQLYRIGKTIKDENLCAYASYLLESGISSRLAGGSLLYRYFTDIFMPQPEKMEYTVTKVSWFRNIQLIAARDAEGDTGGLFFSAKGGHNFERHNHNDVGNFIVYCDGEPVIIDVGVGTYTRQTFGPERYSIWTMQSCYHNTPEINGFSQPAGREFKAADVMYASTESETKLSMDISRAYPDEAGATKFIRAFTFLHDKYLEVKDSYELNNQSKPLILNFMCVNKPVIDRGTIHLGGSVYACYDDDALEASVEEIFLDDAALASSWEKDAIYRLRLITKAIPNVGEITIRFKTC